MAAKVDRVLWADDEIDLLKPHIFFLQDKGYEVVPVVSGQDAIDCCKEQSFDIIFLDENMPGLTGLETLALIKEIDPNVPVVMVTKSEEESIMNQAIGNKIADYLIKPVNPNQLLLSIKKNVHKNVIISQTTTVGYQQEFGRIGMQINDSLTTDDWMEVYKKLIYWELELESSQVAMTDMLRMQKEEANHSFARFISRNYEHWVNHPDDRPTMSPDVMKRCVFPRLSKGRKVFMLVLDNFRYDQWRVLSQELQDDFDIDEDLYFSILPTATQYARNAIFAGLMPLQIRQMYPELWVEEEEDEGKNLNEEMLIRRQLERFRRREAFTYHKVNDSVAADKLLSQFNALSQSPFNVLVINFIDILSHARTESRMVRELAGNESAYRSITLSWFRHTPIKELFSRLASLDYDIIITTDHGSIRVDQPTKVVGDRNVNTNLRYKLGRNLSYNAKEVIELRQPKLWQLPAPNLSTAYVFATGARFFAYPNNYNYYVQYYRDTFQHGGVSMEEMMVPLVVLKPKAIRK